MRHTHHEMKTTRGEQMKAMGLQAPLTLMKAAFAASFLLLAPSSVFALTISANPSGGSVTVGQTITFTAQNCASAPCYVQLWRQGGGQISGDQEGSNSYTPSIAETITITAIAHDDGWSEQTSANFTYTITSGGGGGGGGSNNPVPQMGGLGKTSVPAGSGDTIIDVYGSDFIPNQSTVIFGGFTLTDYTFRGSNQINAVVPASQLQTPRTVQVTVFNPPPGGGTSSPSPTPFTVAAAQNQPPTANSQTVTVVAGSPANTVDIQLSGNDPDGQVVSWNIVSGPYQGTPSSTNGSISSRVTYTANPLLNAGDSDDFDFTVTDNQGGTSASTGKVVISYIAPPVSLSIDPKLYSGDTNAQLLPGAYGGDETNTLKVVFKAQAQENRGWKMQLLNGGSSVSTLDWSINSLGPKEPSVLLLPDNYNLSGHAEYNAAPFANLPDPVYGSYHVTPITITANPPSGNLTNNNVQINATPSQLASNLDFFYEVSTTEREFACSGTPTTLPLSIELPPGNQFINYCARNKNGINPNYSVKDSFAYSINTGAPIIDKSNTSTIPVYVPNGGKVELKFREPDSDVNLSNPLPQIALRFFENYEDGVAWIQQGIAANSKPTGGLTGFTVTSPSPREYVISVDRAALGYTSGMRYPSLWVQDSNGPSSKDIHNFVTPYGIDSVKPTVCMQVFKKGDLTFWIQTCKNEASNIPNECSASYKATPGLADCAYPPTSNGGAYTFAVDVRMLAYDPQSTSNQAACTDGSAGVTLPGFTVTSSIAESQPGQINPPACPANAQTGVILRFYNNVTSIGPTSYQFTAGATDLASNSFSHTFPLTVNEPNVQPTGFQGSLDNNNQQLMNYVWTAPASPVAGYRLCKTAACANGQYQTYGPIATVGQLNFAPEFNTKTQAVLRACADASCNSFKDALVTNTSGNTGTVWIYYTGVTAPTNLAATNVTENAAQITFNGGANSQATRYSVESTGPNAFPASPWAAAQGGVALGNLPKANTAYAFKVKVKNGENDGEDSQNIYNSGVIQKEAAGGSFITKPKAPSNVQISAVTENTISATFTAAPENAAGTKYYLEATTTGSPKLSPEGTSGPLTIGTLSAGTQYQIRACAVDADTVRKQNACSQEAVPGATKFSAPTGIQVIHSTNRDDLKSDDQSFTIRVTRNPAEQPACMKLVFSPAPSGGFLITQAPASGTDFKVTGVPSNTAFSGIKAQLGLQCDANDQSLSGASPNASNEPAYSLPTAPGQAPTMGTIQSNGSVTATFTAPTNNPSNTQYVLEAMEIEGSETPDWDSTSASIISGTPVSGGATSLSLPAGKLQPTGQNYAFSVLALSVDPINLPTHSILDARSPDTTGGGKRADPLNVIVDNTKDKTTETSYRVELLPASAATLPTHIKVSMSYVDSAGIPVASLERVAPAEASGTRPGYIGANIPVPQPNTRYFSIKASVGDSSNANHRSWSNAVASVPTEAFSKPIAPAVPTAQMWTTSATATFVFPNNPAQPTATKYYLQSAPYNGTEIDWDTVSDKRNSSKISQGANGATSPVLTILGMTPGTYDFRVCVENIDSTDPSPLDNCSESSRSVGRIAAGTIVEVTSDSIKAKWVVPEAKLGGVTELRAIVVGADGNKSSDPVAPGTTPEITVKGLTPNTPYTTVYLEYFDGTIRQEYLGSRTPSAITLAAEPPKPVLNVSGSAPTFNLVVDPDLTQDVNAADSEYAIEVTSNSQTAQFLSGIGTMVANPVWLSRAAWTTAAATLNNAGLANVYKVRVAVKQKSPVKTVFGPYATRSMPGGTILVEFPSINGQEMDDHLFGVNVNGPFRVNFSNEMNAASFTGLVTLTKLPENTQVPVTLTYNDNNADGIHELTIAPQGALEPVSNYRMNIAAGLKDKWNFGTSQTFEKQFVTGLNPAVKTTIYGPYDDQKRNPIVVEANTLPASTIVIPRTRFVNPSRSITLAQTVIDNALGLNRLIREAARMEVLFYNLQGQTYVLGAAPKPVKLTMGTPVSGASTAAASSNALAAGGADPAQLSIFLVTSQGLQAVPGAVNNGDGTVTASITQSGLYVLAGAVSVDLSAAYAYPVPFKPSAGHTIITFKNLAADTKVRVYTIMGEKVVELSDDDADGIIQWPVTNSDGDRVASGVYVYQIKNSHSEKRGKLMIIR